MKAIACETLTGKETSTVHKFQAADLGLAPFTFTGEVTTKVYCACPGAPVQPGSTCDYCGTCIKNEFWVRSADGRTFKVGCDCIRKTGDAGLIQQISAAERKLRDQKNAAARQRKWERTAARIEAAKQTLPSVRHVLAGEPHPVPHHAANGLTKLDYVNWLLDNNYGEKAAFAIEQAAKN